MINKQDSSSVLGFNNIRVTKKIQRAYQVQEYNIDKFWDDVIYSEEEEEDANEQKSKYKRYKKIKNERN